MEIKKSEFVKGVIGDNYSLNDGFPHISFFGRSNVGKSSTINSLVNKKSLVKTSKKPGRTREANFFRINGSFYFVDFPGYGYAKRPVKERDKMIKRIFWYIENSSNRPEAVFLIIDINAGLTPLDEEMIKALKENNHKFFVIANKSDKLNKSDLEKKVSEIKKEGINVVPFSAKKGKGREEILSITSSLISR